MQLDRIEGAYRLTVIARDMPALFASFAGAISSFGLDILKAEAFSNARGTILDTFVFADPQRTLELNPPESERLLDLIRRVALGKTDGQRLLRGRAMPIPRSVPRPRAWSSIPMPATPRRWSKSSPKTAPACCTAWLPCSPPPPAISMSC